MLYMLTCCTHENKDSDFRNFPEKLDNLIPCHLSFFSSSFQNMSVDLKFSDYAFNFISRTRTL